MSKQLPIGKCNFNCTRDIKWAKKNILRKNLFSGSGSRNETGVDGYNLSTELHCCDHEFRQTKFVRAYRQKRAVRIITICANSESHTHGDRNQRLSCDLSRHLRHILKHTSPRAYFRCFTLEQQNSSFLKRLNAAELITRGKEREKSANKWKYHGGAERDRGKEERDGDDDDDDEANQSSFRETLKFKYNRNYITAKSTADNHSQTQTK